MLLKLSEAAVDPSRISIADRPRKLTGSHVRVVTYRSKRASLRLAERPRLDHEVSCFVRRAWIARPCQRAWIRRGQRLRRYSDCAQLDRRMDHAAFAARQAALSGGVRYGVRQNTTARARELHEST